MSEVFPPKKLTAHLLPYQLLKVCLAKFSVIKEGRIGVYIRVHSLVNNPARRVNLVNFNSICVMVRSLWGEENRHNVYKCAVGSINHIIRSIKNI